MAKHEINYGEKSIQFELERKDVKNINLNVKPDMSVVVSANESIPLDFIKRTVKDKARWILKNINYFKDTQPKEINKEYVSGESIKYLGKQYRLKVIESKQEQEEVKYYRGYIYLYTINKDDYQKKKELISKWLRNKSQEKFNDALDKMYPQLKRYGVSKPKIKIKTMKARWGSCLKDSNTILLNSELIKAPKHCIDYVVLHELIHFKYTYHNQDFYDFLTALMPDWKQRKEILDQEVVKEL
ncbi:M48 family metallopeptidase [Natroniella sp. ANB-PHB2]|uniref:M48 family metallopeptidase n=1 Tax=Natroniella sp. ANB-PHB2 TaxID=3384444 RepID=UPI0038D3B313